MQNKMTKGRKVLLLGVDPYSLVLFRAPLVRYLVQQGYDVHVASMPGSAEQTAFLQSLGAQFHVAAFARAGMNPLRDVRTVLALRELFLTVRPDVLLSYTSKPVIYGTLAARLAGVGSRVAMITGLGYSFIDGPETKRRVARLVSTLLYRLALPFCNAVIFQNPDDRDEFVKRGLLQRVRSVSIVNGSGVDTHHYAVQTLPPAPVFLMMARLIADKGVREYARACAVVRQQFSAARFLLVGPKDPSPNAVTDAELTQWEADGIEYLGLMEDVRPVIASASVLVLPSYREGTPRSVLEAMAMGRAIITTDAPGCRETVVEGVNGLLVPVRDADGLASAMLKLAADPAQIAAMGQESRRIAEQKYDAVAVAADTATKAGLSGMQGQ